MNKHEIREIDTAINAPAAPEGSMLSEMLAEFAQAPDDNGTFYAKLPNGKKLLCKKIFDGKKMRELQKAATIWGREQAALEPGEIIEAWKPYHVSDADVYASVWLFSKLCLEPDFHGNELNCLIAFRRMGPIFNGILDQINLASCNLLESDAKAMEAAGKD
jgi:hypothetical protein